MSIANKIRVLIWSCLGGTLAVSGLLILLQILGESRGAALESELADRGDRLARVVEGIQEQQGIVQRILRESDVDTLLALVARDTALSRRIEEASDSLGALAFDSSFHRLNTLDSQVVSLVVEGRTGEGQDLYLDRVGRLMNGMMEARAEVAAAWKIEAETRRQAWRSLRGFAFATILVLVAAGVAAGAFFGRKLAKGIVGSLEETQRTMEDIAAGEGDLTRRLHVSGDDEIGRLALAFNHFVERVHATVKTVEGGVHTLGGASERIGRASKGLVEGAGAVARRSREVSDSARTVGDRVGSASRSTGSLSQGLSMVASAIEEMSASVREISRSCQTESQLANQADKDVGEARGSFRVLATTVGEMTSLLDGIQDISDQTQLLALNATIEAARAGEAGRGFAVVAASVKDLAKQASGTTKEIGGRIEAMTLAMKGAEASISSLERVVGSVRAESGSVAAAVEEQEATIAELSRSMGVTHQQSESIASDVLGASESTESAAREIEVVSRDVSRVVEEIGVVREGVREIEDLSGTLRELVGRFRT